MKKRRSQWVLQLRFQQVPGSISHTQLPLLSSGPLSPGQAKGPVGSGGGKGSAFFFFLPWILDLDKGEVRVKGQKEEG